MISRSFGVIRDQLTSDRPAMNCAHIIRLGQIDDLFFKRRSYLKVEKNH